MAFALGQRHIAFSRDPVIRRILFTPGVSNEGGLIFGPQGCGVKHFTPKEARRFYLSSGVFPSRMFFFHITCSRHQSLQKFEFELTKSFVMIFLMILQRTI